MSRLLLPFVIFVWMSPVRAASFDECILKNMRGVTSDAAARAVQTACLHTAERAMPTVVADNLNAGAHAGFVKGRGFFLELENRTAYTITSISVVVVPRAGGGSSTYTVDYFEPEGVSNGSVIVTDHFGPALHSIQPGQKLTFRVPIAEVAESSDDFAQRFAWRITGARGFQR